MYSEQVCMCEKERCVCERGNEFNYNKKLKVQEQKKSDAFFVT